ncbi:kinase-like domain-containing protein [Xylaria longipes]|nr:kinase-like domain-containing protein [Xylaria longipes]RYC57334.1 hypothetical protein CHU98_g8871 [Xylaria longipes]
MELTLEQLNARVQLERRRLQDTFGGTQGWVLERHLGNGGFGITALLKDSDPLKRRREPDPFRIPIARRVVLKWALFPEQGIFDFITEINALKFLRGKAHHAQFIAATTEVSSHRPVNVLSVRNVFRRFIAPFKNPPTEIFNILRRHRGPAILLEYIAGGTLSQLSRKAQERGVQLPNRILWSFYLCLVRACLGLSYPHVIPEPGQPQVLETITAREPNGFAHNDISLRNIMLDHYDFNVGEHGHGTIPRLKFIDYGASRNIGDHNAAARSNFFSIAIVMLRLINPRLRPVNDDNTMLYNGIMTYATDILPNPGADAFAYLDPELRQLLAEATAVDENLRPSMADIFNRAQRGAQKIPMAYGNLLPVDYFNQDEDNNIRRLFQHTMYDA